MKARTYNFKPQTSNADACDQRPTG